MLTTKLEWIALPPTRIPELKEKTSVHPLETKKKDNVILFNLYYFKM